jgi:hypothetical protein
MYRAAVRPRWLVGVFYAATTLMLSVGHSARTAKLASTKRLTIARLSSSTSIRARRSPNYADALRHPASSQDHDSLSAVRADRHRQPDSILHSPYLRSRIASPDQAWLKPDAVVVEDAIKALVTRRLTTRRSDRRFGQQREEIAAQMTRKARARRAVYRNASDCPT